MESRYIEQLLIEGRLDEAEQLCELADLEDQYDERATAATIAFVLGCLVAILVLPLCLFVANLSVVSSFAIAGFAGLLADAIIYWRALR